MSSSFGYGIDGVHESEIAQKGVKAISKGEQLQERLNDRAEELQEEFKEKHAADDPFPVPADKDKAIRTFETGATRDAASGKPDYEGFLSPLALVRYGQYMNRHRVQSDGEVRASDNWQKGIPIVDYMSSLLRHVMDLWCLHRGVPVHDIKDGHTITKQEALCGILFNAFGYLHEILRWNKNDDKKPSS